MRRTETADSRAEPRAADVGEVIRAAHERLLREYHAAWREALQVRSREEALWRPRRTYLAVVPRVFGTLMAFALTGWRWSWSVPSNPAAREEYQWRMHHELYAGHAASFVRRFIGGHLSGRLRSLSKVYVQLARSQYFAEGDRPQFADMAKECEELAGTFPTWRDSARSVIPVLGLALGPTLAVLAVDGASQILLTTVAASNIFVLALLMTAFESFRLTRELLFPGARERELRRDASPPEEDERNTYWTETRLHRALGWPQERELPVDYALGLMACVSVAVLVAVPVVRLLPDDDVASVIVWALLVALPILGWFSLNWLGRKRFWR